jgi:hypothetical protein
VAAPVSSRSQAKPPKTPIRFLTPFSPPDRLADSVPVGNTGGRRIAYDADNGEIVVFNRDRDWWGRADDGVQERLGGIWHGHVQPWGQLRPEMRRALIDAGLFNIKGKYIGAKP